MGENIKGRRPMAAALQYHPTQDQAPKVVAKGQGFIAEEIIARAREEGIPIQEAPALVGALCKLELEQEIPSELYEAVARVLAFLLFLEQKGEAE